MNADVTDLLRRRRLGENLLRAGHLTQEKLDIAVKQQKMLRVAGITMELGEIIVRLAFASRAQVEEAVRQTGDSLSGFSDFELPAYLSRRLKLVVVGIKDEVLTVASALSLSEIDKQEILEAARFEGAEVHAIEVDVTDRNEILKKISLISLIDAQGLAEEINKYCHDVSDGQLLQAIVEHILIDAIQSRASDIHIDRSENPLENWISYRVDGVRRLRYPLTVEAMGPLMTFVKNKSRMDASETKRSQDGRMTTEYRGRMIDCRVATRPLDGGEALTIRLLDQSAIKPLNVVMEDHRTIYQNIRGITGLRHKTSGLMIVSGPTGHGKTTTLNAMLLDMDRHALNIMTTEDPVEFQIPLVRQSAVNPLIGMDYPSILRGDLRMDPDVLVIGELRDLDTTAIALRAVESGHTVLGTLHTTDVSEVFSRLASMLPDESRELGLHTLAKNLKGVMNQRLVRRICRCAACVDIAALDAASQSQAAALGLPAHGQVMVAKGCERCDHSGYIGRSLVLEALFLPPDAAVRGEIKRTLMGSEFNPSHIQQIAGVTYLSRNDSVLSLLLSLKIDLPTALDVTELTGFERMTRQVVATVQKESA